MWPSAFHPTARGTPPSHSPPTPHALAAASPLAPPSPSSRPSRRHRRGAHGLHPPIALSCVLPRRGAATYPFSPAAAAAASIAMTHFSPAATMELSSAFEERVQQMEDARKAQPPLRPTPMSLPPLPSSSAPPIPNSLASPGTGPPGRAARPAPRGTSWGSAGSAAPCRAPPLGPASLPAPRTCPRRSRSPGTLPRRTPRALRCRVGLRGKMEWWPMQDKIDGLSDQQFDLDLLITGHVDLGDDADAEGLGEADDAADVLVRE